MTVIENGTTQSAYHGFPKILEDISEYDAAEAERVATEAERIAAEAVQKQQALDDQRSRFLGERAFWWVVQGGF